MIHLSNHIHRMKLPSLTTTFEKAIATFKRFPLPILAAISASFIAISLIEANSVDTDFSWQETRKCLLLLLAIPACISFQIISERNNNRLMRWIPQLLVAVYFFWIYSSWENKNVDGDWAYFFLIAIALHLMVSFAPFVTSNDTPRFWEYNKNLFLRILTAGLYSGVLFAGLALAILAIDQLFDADINERRYAQLFMFIAMVFNTWFFLSGFPLNSDEAEVAEYPKGLRVFTQFVLLPLVTVYLLILYAYSAKILFTMNWPRGWVSYLVIGFSTAGILALLLIWPMREDEKHRWIKLYARGFFFALFPLVVLLFFSIYLRIAQYGITLNRYYVIALALWLLFIAGYFLISRTKRIKLIPVSLFFVALISNYGPFSAFAVSVDSQRDRLIEIGEKYRFFKDGKFVKVQQPAEVTYDDNKTFYEVLDYLTDTYHYDAIQDLFAVDINAAVKKSGRYRLDDSLLASVGLSYEPGTGSYGRDHFSFSSNAYNQPLKVTGFDYCFTWDYYSGKRDDNERINLTDSLFVVLNFNGDELKLKSADGSLLGSLKISDLRQRLNAQGITDSGSADAEDLISFVENDKVKLQVQFKYVNGRLINNGASSVTESINSMVLLKLK